MAELKLLSKSFFLFEFVTKEAAESFFPVTLETVWLPTLKEFNRNLGFPSKALIEATKRSSFPIVKSFQWILRILLISSEKLPKFTLYCFCFDSQ
eukprot:02090.XXX_16992_17276_1 [CDS] Oithona nana genome sequencing.